MDAVQTLDRRAGQDQEPHTVATQGPRISDRDLRRMLVESQTPGGLELYSRQQRDLLLDLIDARARVLDLEETLSFERRDYQVELTQVNNRLARAKAEAEELQASITLGRVGDER